MSWSIRKNKIQGHVTKFFKKQHGFILSYKKPRQRWAFQGWYSVLQSQAPRILLSGCSTILHFTAVQAPAITTFKPAGWKKDKRMLPKVTQNTTIYLSLTRTQSHSHFYCKEGRKRSLYFRELCDQPQFGGSLSKGDGRGWKLGNNSSFCCNYKCFWMKQTQIHITAQLVNLGTFFPSLGLSVPSYTMGTRERELGCMGSSSALAPSFPES